MELKQIAQSLPYPIQQPLRYIYGVLPLSIRYGRMFEGTYAFLQESQWWSREKLEEYQMQQLSKLLHHAYQNVPYYQRVFDERGLKPKDIQDFNDLGKLPYLTKEIVRENLSELIAQNYGKSRLHYVTTSGSTGTPLWFYHERNVSSAKEHAFMLTQWGRVGFKMGDRSVILRGEVVRSASKGKFWKYDPVRKNLILSSFHMTDQTLPKYIAEIREFKPDFIQAYPQVITTLARFMKENNLEPFPSVKALLCGSENLYSWQRELLKEVFQCRLYSWYGNTEMVTLAGECEKNTFYHIFSEYGITELIKPDGTPANSDGEIGVILGTGFNNYAMPFIRYKTQDLAVRSCEECSCGRNYALIRNVEGRLQEFIVGRDNHLIPLGDMQIARIFDNVRQFQFHQHKKGEVIFNVVKKYSYTERDTACIREEILKRLGNDMKLEIRFVDHIPPTKSGKYRFLIQKLPIEFGD